MCYVDAGYQKLYRRVIQAISIDSGIRMAGDDLRYSEEVGIFCLKICFDLFGCV